MLLFISSRVPCELVADFLDVYIYICMSSLFSSVQLHFRGSGSGSPASGQLPDSQQPSNQPACQAASSQKSAASCQTAGSRRTSQPARQPAASQPAAGEPVRQTGDHTWGRLSMWTGNAEAGGPVTSKPAPNREVRCGPVTSKHVDR